MLGVRLTALRKDLCTLRLSIVSLLDLDVDIICVLTFFFLNSATGNNATIATTMRDYFISFFVHHDPNVETFSAVLHPYWNQYNADGTFQVLDVNYTMIGMSSDDDASPQCDFLHGQGGAVRN